MKDDYLWGGSGPPDPDVDRLERMLGQLRSVPPPLRLPAPPARRRWASTVPLLAAAAAIALMVGSVWISTHPRGASWEVSSLSGRPRIGGAPVGSTSRLAIGDTLSTDADARASIEVSTIGQVMVEGNTRMKLVSSRAAHHRL